MSDFHQLKVWEKSHALTLAIYRKTSAFLVEERYGLTSQLRRASASIPANIAEGCGRGGDAELTRFLRIALGSATELEYHLLLARDLDLLDYHIHLELRNSVLEIQRMLASLIQSLVNQRVREAEEPYLFANDYSLTTND